MSCSSDESAMGADKSSYPRTGRRGVPQQFPRKLYEMLEAESEEGILIVHWSGSGRAFRIADVSLFSTKILPKYFKTSKFSSFQRNLNLYGFTKIRKGPEIDMYFHPGFIRGAVDGLSQLRKRTKSPIKIKNKKNQAIHPFTPQAAPSADFSFSVQQPIRIISPTISRCVSSESYDKPHHSFKPSTHSESYGNAHNSFKPSPNSASFGNAYNSESYGNTHHTFKPITHSFYRKSNYARRSSERLTMLADAMVMMIKGE